MKTTIIASFGLLAITACSNHPATTSTNAQDGIKVNVATVKEVMVNTDLHYSGTVEPQQSIPLTFQSTGIITQVLVQEGDAVRKGQLLATVDKSDNESMYNAAVAKYRQAKDAYDRLKVVYDKGSLPEIKWVEMETNLKQAQSQMELSKSSLSKSSLRAPVAGIIGKRNVEPGQHSASAVTPLEIVRIERIYVKVAVPENEIGKIRKGLKATFTISALNDRTFEGTITNVGVVADQISRTYEVKIEAANPQILMKPGMVCDVKVHQNQLVKATVAPYQAVNKDDQGKTYVFEVDTIAKKAKKTTVTAGQYDQNGVIILSGLSANSLVVTEGKEKLTNNAKIVY
ncbi:efflux RND transporter periplasmic adaptor subunit [uncultured Acetobacteroides sp.]|uniref:efflux RND transporter periplasmic adaptor subunit n=1 Tax=uncultured Acetobacteroides sp. TaxID=1760811 RepID=UPI0029F5296E|nr:efflux RND transporter periplasmic adaptor subunit [uncultured Acetobacteroides sp.]